MSVRAVLFEVLPADLQMFTTPRGRSFAVFRARIDLISSLLDLHRYKCAVAATCIGMQAHWLPTFRVDERVNEAVSASSTVVAALG